MAIHESVKAEISAEAASQRTGSVVIDDAKPGESLPDYISRTSASIERVKAVLGAANPFKEGDATIGVAAVDDDSRRAAAELIANTPIGYFDQVALLDDSVRDYIAETTDANLAAAWRGIALGELKRFVLNENADTICERTPGLSSDAIAAVVKLMSNEELTRVGGKLFFPLPGTGVGAPGNLSARVQPNSPTDNPEDIRWQVFSAFSYAVGDVVLGTNPVSSVPADVARIQRTLKDIIETFELEDILPWCVLSHIDVQAEVEAMEPGLVSTAFQSLGGCDGTNHTFGLTTEKLRDHARRFQHGLYFETGQGADFTNEAGDGLDMVLLESRKYGLARGLSQETSGFVHVNDVAGFIGPEVFRTKEQLVRCCLEDIAMAKLHGLCFGLDVCATLHMSLSPADLDWCFEHVIEAAPAYLLGLRNKNDPMLSYMTTGFQDHLRLRRNFGLGIDARMTAFFERLGILDAQGEFTEHAGDPLWVYLQYRRAKGDTRDEREIVDEGRVRLGVVHVSVLMSLFGGFGEFRF
ncbi:MAG: ethanolamine ammonia-lyase subunit EutB [Myxococcota bacterium]